MSSRQRTSTARLLGAVLAAAAVAPAVQSAAGAVSAAQTALQRYTVTDLGTLGGSEGAALGINDVGQVAGYSTTGDFGAEFVEAHGFVWQNGALTDLGVLGGDLSIAFDLNSSGQAAGFGTTGDLDENGDPVLHALRWTNGRAEDLGVLPGGVNSLAFAINDAGVVAGSSEARQAGPFDYPLLRAVRWQNGAVEDLGTHGGDFSHAQGINRDGVVVGGAETADAERYLATAWEPTGSPFQLGLLPGGTYSQADDTNDSFQVVGGSETEQGTFEAFLYDGDALTRFGTLGGPYSEAFGINNSGVAVGTADTAARDSEGNFVPHAFVWQGSRLVDLNSQIPAGSGWQILGVDDINSAGQIVGHGLFNGELRPCLLSPAGEDAGRFRLGSLAVPLAEVGGARVVGQVSLAGGFGAGAQRKQKEGFRVRLRSSHPKLVRVPREVPIRLNRGFSVFPIKTAEVRTPTEVTVTASAGAETQTVSIVLFPRGRTAASSTPKVGPSVPHWSGAPRGKGVGLVRMGGE